MQNITLDLGKRSYNITVGSGAIKALGKYLLDLKIGSDAYIITNNFIKSKYGPALTGSLDQSGFGLRYKVVPDTEKAKSIVYATMLIRDLASFDKKRKIFIIAFGGGVVGDLAGFVASVYKRGVPYIQIPTTLLAQVDSSIGGKTAVDLEQGKNLVGAIYQPRLVLSDIDFLKSLNREQLRSGLAEVIKYGAIKDKHLFEYVEKNIKSIFRRDIRKLAYMVLRSVMIKARIVGKDEKEEKGLRTILNFGHTFGHAIETAGGYDKYNHGEAVALGMLLALDLGARLNINSKETALRIERLIRKAGLPVRIKGLSLGNIIKAQYKDKKFSGAKNRFVFIEAIGKARVVQGVPLTLIKEIIKGRLA